MQTIPPPMPSSACIQRPPIALFPPPRESATTSKVKAAPGALAFNVASESSTCARLVAKHPAELHESDLLCMIAENNSEVPLVDSIPPIKLVLQIDDNSPAVKLNKV